MNRRDMLLGLGASALLTRSLTGADKTEHVTAGILDGRDLPACLSSRADCDCDGCLNRRQTLTGDWWGARPSLEEQGITFDASVTQFYQGVASGGLQQQCRYGGHGDYDLSFDFGKLCELDRVGSKYSADIQTP